jgi:phage terminase large subunit
MPGAGFRTPQNNAPNGSSPGSGSAMALSLSPEEELLAIQEELRSRGKDLETALEAPTARELVGGIDYSQFHMDPVGFCRDVLKAHLWSKQREIIEAIRDGRRVSVRSSHGVGKCIRLNSRIPLVDGRVVEAKDLVGTWVPLLAFSKDGQQVPAVATASDNGMQPCLRLRTEGGREIEGTYNHPLQVASLEYQVNPHRRARLPKPQGWKNLEDIQPGDLVLVPTRLEIQGSERRPIEEVKFCAYMLGDGGSTGGQITFTQEPGKVREEFLDLLSSWDCKARCYKDICLYVSGVVRGENKALTLMREWDLKGKLSKEKTFPDWVWGLPNDQLALFLNRLFACDGYAYINNIGGYSGKHRRGFIGITLASEGMIRDVEMAFLRLGISGHVCKKKAKFQDKEFDAWEWSISEASQVLRFASSVGIFGKEAAVEKVAELAQSLNSRYAIKWPFLNAPEGFRWEKAASVEEIGLHPTVAITVPDYETYITTFVEHNSFVAACAAIWYLFTRPGSIVITTAPTARQVNDILWRELRQMIVTARLPGRLLNTKLEIHEKWYAEGLSTDDPNKFTGFHAPDILVICDEAAGIAQAIYDAMKGLLTTERARVLLIGNPTEVSGTFFDSHHHMRHRWTTIHIDAKDSPNFTGEPCPPEVLEQLVNRVWWDEMLDDYGSEDHPLFQIRVRGNFPGQSEDTLIPLPLLIRAEALIPTVEDFYDPEYLLDEEPVVAALDPARSGGAENAICVRKGSNILLQTAFHFSKEDAAKPLTMIAAGRFQDICQGFAPDVWRVDANGLGAGIADRLIELGLIVDRYNSGNSAINKDRFVYQRDEDYWNFRERLEAGRVGNLLDEKCRGQLAAIKYTWDSHSRITVESKKAMKARGIPSPDRADAAVMAFKPALLFQSAPEVGGRREELDSYQVL